MSRRGRMRPSPAHDALLRAALHPDPDVALAAYDGWSARVDLDAADIATVLMLPLLSARAGAFPPRPALDRQIANVVRFTWLQSQVLAARGAPVLRALGERGIGATLVKGAALVHAHGLDPRVRTMSDLDLLIAPEDIVAVVGVLRELGFGSRVDRLVDTDAALVRERLHASDYSEAGGGRIDLHWHPMHDARHPEISAAMRAETVPAVLAGVPCRAAGLESTLVLVVAHGTRWAKTAAVRWVGDVALLLRAHGDVVDWDRVVAHARRGRLSRSLLDALDYLEDVAGVVAPPDARRALWRSPTPVAVRLRRVRRDGTDGGPRPPGRVGRLADAYEDAVSSTVVPAGARTGPPEALRFLARRWDLERATAVPAHAAWVAAGRPWPARDAWQRRRGTVAVAPDWWPRYELGADLLFTDATDAHRYLGPGWWFSEVHGTWSRAPVARARLPCVGPRPTTGLPLELTIAGLVGERRTAQRVDVVVGNVRVARRILRAPARMEMLDLRVPHGALTADGLAEIALVSSPAAPADLRIGTDTRQLGVTLHSVRLG